MTHMTRMTSSTLAAPLTSFFVANTKRGMPASSGLAIRACISSVAVCQAMLARRLLADPEPAAAVNAAAREERSAVGSAAVAAGSESCDALLLSSLPPPVPLSGRGMAESTTKTIADTPLQ